MGAQCPWLAISQCARRSCASLPTTRASCCRLGKRCSARRRTRCQCVRLAPKARCNKRQRKQDGPAGLDRRGRRWPSAVEGRGPSLMPSGPFSYSVAKWESVSYLTGYRRRCWCRVWLLAFAIANHSLPAMLFESFRKERWGILVGGTRNVDCN
jgi:hypothetical protein